MPAAINYRKPLGTVIVIHYGMRKSTLTIEVLEDRRMLAADLTGAFAGHIPAALPVDGVSQIEVRLTNIGKAITDESAEIQLFLSSTPTPHSDDLLLASKQKNLRLKTRQSINAKLAVPSPSNLPTGEYFILAEVNGSVVTSSAVKIQAPFSDLAVAITGLPVMPVEINGYSSGTRVATVDVTNSGNLRTNGFANVRLYLSADGMLDSTASLLASSLNTKISLKPGGRKAVRFRIAVPPGTAEGGYFLIAQLAPGVADTDANAANNVAISTRRIAVVTQLPHPTTVNKTVNVYAVVGGSGGGGDIVDVVDGVAVIAVPCDDGDGAVSDDPSDGSNFSPSPDATDDACSSTQDSPDNGDLSDSSGGDF